MNATPIFCGIFSSRTATSCISLDVNKFRWETPEELIADAISSSSENAACFVGIIRQVAFQLSGQNILDIQVINFLSVICY